MDLTRQFANYWKNFGFLMEMSFLSDEAKKDRLYEMRCEIASYLEAESGAGDNAGDYILSENEAMEIVEDWTDQTVIKKYQELCL